MAVGASGVGRLAADAGAEGGSMGSSLRPFDEPPCCRSPCSWPDALLASVGGAGAGVGAGAGGGGGGAAGGGQAPLSKKRIQLQAASRTRLVRDATTCGGPALPSPQPKPCARDASRAACGRCVAAARSELRSWVSLRRPLPAGRLPASPWPACPRVAGRWRWTGCAPCAATAARLPGVAWLAARGAQSPAEHTTPVCRESAH